MVLQNSKIILAKNINIDRDYVNVLDYTEEEMLALVRQNKVYENSNYSFIRPQNDIYVQINYGYALQCNYIAFQNTDYSNKWFFAWIDEVIFISNNTVQIKYTVDAWSTWFSKIQVKPCYVLRHHVNDDVIGNYLQEENLNVGDVVSEEYDEYTDAIEDYYIIMLCTYDLITKRAYSNMELVNGNVLSSMVYIFNNTDVVSLQYAIQDIIEQASVDNIRNIFILPKYLIDNLGIRKIDNSNAFGSYSYYVLNLNNDTSKKNLSFAWAIDKTTSFSDYTPKNKKLFVYPYNYLFFTNNIGNNNIYKYENFINSDTCLFDVQMAFSIGGSIRAVPRNYKGIDYNIDEALALGKFPTCEWNADAFTNWLTQNAVNVGSQILTGLASFASGNFVGAGATVASLIGTFYQASLQPTIQKGQNEGDINYSSNSNTFRAYHMRAKTEYLKIIDDYFSRYGYKINMITTPNITGRKNFNYVEIGGAEEIGTGEIPSNFMETINKACRRGTTVWHNHANIGNFTLDNSII